MLTLKVYNITKGFPKEELYGITNQVRRSTSSIPANIAEGCGKYIKLDLAQFLNIALGSANETEYFLLLCRDLNYITDGQYNLINSLANEVKAMLISLINKIRQKNKKHCN